MTNFNLIDLENFMKTPEMKESLAMNKRIHKLLKSKFKNKLTSKEYKNILAKIPEYNIKNESEAAKIGCVLCNNLIFRKKVNREAKI